MLKALRNICFALVAFAPCGAHSAQMVNVEYIHKLIARDRGIEIDYSPKLSTPKVAANMKYLLTVVDIANKRLNGRTTTNYGNGEYATMVAADTIATNRAIAKLITITPQFTITTTPDTTKFQFKMSARGRFVVDWGDGKSIVINRDNTDMDTYSHTYNTPGRYQIKMLGRATGYVIPTTDAAISFEKNQNIAAISGSLGAIFPTIGTPTTTYSGLQPRFNHTFADCSRLSGSIPPELFQGIRGLPDASMFYGTFRNCSNLTGAIPPGLFGELSGAPAANMFHSTFSGCENLSGEIPAGLFGDIKGSPKPAMFDATFLFCGNLSGPIPAGLFGELSGAPAANMFYNTFNGCENLSGEIPAGLFGELSGAPAAYMFAHTFFKCGNLSGEIPTGLFGKISGDAAPAMFASTFTNCGKLSGEIPAGLFGNISGDAAPNIYYGTFYGCQGLTGAIPPGLFGNISGDAADGMFRLTFTSCLNLTGESAKIGDKYLYEIWPDATPNQVDGCYRDDRKLSDYQKIPATWK